MLKALALTIAIELAVLFLLNKFWLRNEIRLNNLIVAGSLVSSITLPMLWLVLPLFIEKGWLMPVGEAIVIIVEAMLYWPLLNLKPYKAIAVSFVCNMASCFLGGFILYGVGV